MRMEVWEIMEIERSRMALKKAQKKSIDPSIDRSRLDESIDLAADRSTNGGKLQIDRKDTKGCRERLATDGFPVAHGKTRDCPEGMQW